MAIAASGAVSLSDFRSEFVGGSSAISLGDLYRGGSNIRSKAGNNTATNLAANVPTSGAIDFADFYSQAKGFRKTYSSGATNQDASAVFGDDYAVNYPKEIVINSGVELGATSTSQEALQIDSGLSGGLTITNNGTLSGAGGAANGGAGGDAFQADVACTLVNNGTIRAGGGGGGAAGAGGAGGTGGQGSTSSTSLGNRSSPGTTGQHHYYRNIYYGHYQIRWQGSGLRTGTIAGQAVPWDNGGYRYNSGFSVWLNAGGGDYYYDLYRDQFITSYTYYNGGAGGAGGGGGAGGVGQGYGQSAGSGASGSGGSGGAGGGTNAGSGGTGGTGGTGGAGGSFGNSGSSGATGSTGNTGGNGNHTNGSGGSGGSGGSSGGAAGKYIRGLSNVSFTNNGTVQGGTA